MLTYIAPTVNPYFLIWGIFPIFQLFPQPTCFPTASGWGIFPISQLFPHLTTQTNEKRQPTFIDCLKL
jgi:hypothetical protein